MKLRRLDLIRYGRFSDAHIPFPAPANGAPDVTIVYGPNEAGKSTAFNGLLELLFGFKKGAHPYAFAYDRSDLLVGGVLDLPGRGPLTLRRNSKNTQSLLDSHDRPIGEAVLSGALHGLSKEEYEERFSLNDQGLRKGGERIASAQGELGHLLHAGLSGLTGMADALQTLEERADEFHKKQAKKSQLAKGKKRLTELRKELHSHSLTAERAQTLHADVARALGAFDQADAALNQSHRRQAASKAAEVWHAKGLEIERLEDDLADAPSGPTLPEHAAAGVVELAAKIDSLTSRLGEIDADMAAQGAIIDLHNVDDLAELLGAELARLDALEMDGASLISRASTAQGDLGNRRAALSDIEQQIEGVLDHLGVADAQGLWLGMGATDFRQLTAAVERYEDASNALNLAQTAHSTAEEQLGDPPTKPQDLTELRAASQAFEAVADAAPLEAAHDRALIHLSEAAAALPHNWTSLVDAGLPAPETLDAMAATQASLRHDLAAAKKELERGTAALAAAKADLALRQAAPMAVDLAAVEQARRQRDQQWQAHRRDLGSESADQFEAALYADDAARANFDQGAEARQQLRAAAQAASKAAVDHDLATTAYAAVLSDWQHLSVRCTTLATALGFEAETGAESFKARHQELAASAKAAVAVSNADKALQDHRRRHANARQALVAAAHVLGDAGDVGDAGDAGAQGDVPAQVRRALTLEQTGRDAWEAWQQGQRKVQDLAQRLTAAHRDLDQAVSALANQTAALPLPDAAPAGVQAALPALGTLRSLYDKHGDYLSRVNAMEAAISGLKESADRLNHVVVQGGGALVDAAVVDPLTIIDRARQRVAAAKRADDKRQEATAALDTLARTKQGTQSELKAAQAHLAECFDGQGGEDLPPRARIDVLVARDKLRSQSDAAEHQRQQARQGVDGDLFAEELERMPEVTRAQALAQATQDAQGARDTARDAHREAQRVYDEALNADLRNDLSAEQALTRAELREGARKAAVARLGVLAARAALTRLATNRRGQMIDDVQDAFVTMTAPIWKGVEVWSQAAGERLVGIKDDGSKVPVDQMSTGTMGQLYLALRLAGYQSFAAEAGPLPLVLDDIMETFDDTRAMAALHLCAKIGQNGQAILFTHHQHLVALAREHLAGVGIVNMPE